MSKLFFGFAVADSMFKDGTISRQTLAVDGDEWESLLLSSAEDESLVVCLNPSHVATINAMRCRFGIDVAIPTTPPKVLLEDGDRLLVMGVRGLPRLTDRHEYTEAEIMAATFNFTLYEYSA